MQARELCVYLGHHALQDDIPRRVLYGKEEICELESGQREPPALCLELTCFPCHEFLMNAEREGSWMNH